MRQDNLDGLDPRWLAYAERCLASRQRTEYVEDIDMCPECEREERRREERKRREREERKRREREERMKDRPLRERANRRRNRA
jgi:hypothetical protein